VYRKIIAAVPKVYRKHREIFSERIAEFVTFKAGGTCAEIWSQMIIACVSRIWTVNFVHSTGIYQKDVKVGFVHLICFLPMTLEQPTSEISYLNKNREDENMQYISFNRIPSSQNFRHIRITQESLINISLYNRALCVGLLFELWCVPWIPVSLKFAVLSEVLCLFLVKGNL
jgi:hypothetical protein